MYGEVTEGERGNCVKSEKGEGSGCLTVNESCVQRNG